MIASTSVAGYVGSAAALMDFDYRHSLVRLSVPTTLVVGEFDGMPAFNAVLVRHLQRVRP